MRKILALFALSLAAACGAPQQTPAEAPTESLAPAATEVQVQQAWAAPTPGGVDVSAGYLTLVNGGPAEDRLVAASSPRASRVELHEMSMDGGVMRMRAIEGGLLIPAQSEIALAPGGNHLMFFGVTQPFTLGEEIPVTLTFERTGTVDVMLPVRAAAERGEDDMHEMDDAH